jgi:hypothetical protein
MSETPGRKNQKRAAKIKTGILTCRRTNRGNMREDLERFAD